MSLDLLLCSLPKINLVCPHSGIALLSAVTKRAGYKTRVLDLNAEFGAIFKNYFPDHSWESLESVFANREAFYSTLDAFRPWIEIWTERILSLEPRYLGISLFTQRNRFLAVELCRAIRAKDRHLKIIVGGADCAFSKDELSSQGLIDFYILGEAEEAILHILAGRHLFPGVNSRAQPIADLANNPFPDYSDIDFSKYEAHPPAVFVTASRGCPFHCTFCDVRSLWRTYRTRPPAQVAGEMIFCAESYGVRTFLFTDSLLNGDMEHFRDLFGRCRGIRERWDIRWEGFCVISKVGKMKDEDFRLMKESGCDRIKIGVESGSPQVRRHMRKPYRERDLDAFLQGSSRAGLGVDLMLMVGYPTETEGDFEQTKNLLRRHRHFAHDGTIKFVRLDMTFLKDTQPLYEMREELGIAVDPRTGEWDSPLCPPKVRKRRYFELRQHALDLGYRILAAQDAERSAMYEE